MWALTMRVSKLMQSSGFVGSTGVSSIWLVRSTVVVYVALRATAHWRVWLVITSTVRLAKASGPNPRGAFRAALTCGTKFCFKIVS